MESFQKSTIGMKRTNSDTKYKVKSARSIKNKLIIYIIKSPGAIRYISNIINKTHKMILP